MEKGKVNVVPQEALITLTVGGLDLQALEAMMCLVREIAEKDPSKIVTCKAYVVDRKTLEAALQTLSRMMPGWAS